MPRRVFLRQNYGIPRYTWSDTMWTTVSCYGDAMGRYNRYVQLVYSYVKLYQARDTIPMLGLILLMTALY